MSGLKKANWVWLVGAVVLLGLGLISPPAHALLVQPGLETWTLSQTNNCNAACVTATTGISGLTLLYKSNVGGGEEGTLKNSYTTQYFNSVSDPSAFKITYNGGTFASCPQCILLVKDGHHQPAQYLFNLGANPLLWNGTDNIKGLNFWPSGGAISNVAIWGTGGAVPEPASLLLFMVGAAGIAIWDRSRSLRRQKQAV
jgi:hypothetical protein